MSPKIRAKPIHPSLSNTAKSLLTWYFDTVPMDNQIISYIRHALTPTYHISKNMLILFWGRSHAKHKQLVPIQATTSYMLAVLTKEHLVKTQFKSTLLFDAITRLFSEKVFCVALPTLNLRNPGTFIRDVIDQLIVLIHSIIEQRKAPTQQLVAKDYYQ